MYLIIQLTEFEIGNSQHDVAKRNTQVLPQQTNMEDELPPKETVQQNRKTANMKPSYHRPPTNNFAPQETAASRQRILKEVQITLVNESCYA